MSKDGISVRKFDKVMRGLLAVPKDKIQESMTEMIAKKKSRPAKKQKQNG